MGYSALARVYTGWTGTIVYTDAGTGTGTLTPTSRESAASVIARLMVEVVQKLGYTLTVSVSAAGIISVTSSATINLAFTGNTATRTGFTGSYTGGTSYTAAGAYAGGYVPAYGIEMPGLLLATSRGSSVGDGSAGGTPTLESATSRLAVWDSTIVTPDLSQEYDVWHDGRVFGRFTINGAKRAPLGKQRAVDQTRLELDAQEVC